MGKPPVVTERQGQVLRLISAHPGISDREMALVLGISGLQAMQDHRLALRKKGLITWVAAAPGQRAPQRTVCTTPLGYHVAALIEEIERQ